MSFAANAPSKAGGQCVRNRVAARVAWLGWLASYVVIILAVALSLKVQTVAFSLSFGAVLAAFATVGAVVAARHPRNAVGWLCLAVGFLGSVNAVAIPYAEYALVTQPGSLPGGLVMAWLSLWLSYIWGLTVTFLPLLFPTGRPRHRGGVRRWFTTPFRSSHSHTPRR